ncbi:MAG: hypothetical protein RDU24_03135 [Humidesulfovibrio sp.]|uniref:hypothetical protein n=1 Tax=Humidesulfovibrio sp. TaxID=2910988 RepID=UPI0027F716CD|nr:hypothetical protein [Humidesulfovibrio sp.]MDQ7834354.1 hypothetical protein [Humidesulfovibrio sp.]
MARDDFYGNQCNQTVSFLEFGQIDLGAGKKTIWDFRLHQKAYDWFMLGRYSNDLLAYRAMSRDLGQVPLEKIFGHFDEEVHHPMDGVTSVAQMCALAAAEGRSFLEFGQTLYGCIDAMSFVQKLCAQLGISGLEVPLEQVSWFGADLSAMFNELAEVMHPGLHVEARADLGKLPDQVDVRFAKGITLHYAVREPDELFNIMGGAKCALFDYSISLHGRQQATVGTGKTLCYLGVEEFLEERRRLGVPLLVRRSSRHQADLNRVWLDCLYGEAEICARYVSLEAEVRAALREKLSSVATAKRFIGPEGRAEWMPVEDYLAALPKNTGEAGGGVK